MRRYSMLRALDWTVCLPRVLVLVLHFHSRLLDPIAASLGRTGARTGILDLLVRRLEVVCRVFKT